MKRKREPSEKSKKSKTLKLGEPFAARSPAPLDSSISSKSHPSETPSISNLKKISSSLPLPSSTYTPSEPTILNPPNSEHHKSNPSSPSPRKINLITITLLTSDLSPLNKSFSSLSLTPSSPSYYNISYDSENPDPSSPTMAQLQATTLSKPSPSIPDTFVPSPSAPQIEPPFEPQTEPPSELSSEPPTGQPHEPPTETIPTSPKPNNPASDPEPTFPTLEDLVALFSESSTVKLRSLSEQFKLSDNPSEVRNDQNGFLRWMTYEVFKLKGLSEQVRNDYIREVKERLEARLAIEYEEKSRQEAKEKARLEAEEKARKEAEEKAAAEAAAAAEAKAKAKADVKEVTHIDVEEAAKAKEVALTQGESSNSDLAPLVLKALEELQKELQIIRAGLD
ncbi:uncharacterized protein LOC127123359 [Lathyrus oleraceus]|uniref:uncharacterized protein LOC127123359 n=1 Tax=Pisum sativum TaxID=3888 RepID=UPI0021D21A71|nr:uncharacterized protein LOC127123359 [Pisum sativum]